MTDIIIVIIVVGFIIVLAFILYFFPFGLWIRAINSGLIITPYRLIGMRLRKIDPFDIVNHAIMLDKAGIKVPINQLEAHSLAGGKVANVALGLIAAQKAGINLNFKTATYIDLAGRNVSNAVSLCAKSKVINTPVVTAMAKNGIQVKAVASVTIKADINKLIGGASEETVLDSVCECIATTISLAESHEEILENPDRISKVIQEKGLDANTAFKILSIDISFQ